MAADHHIIRRQILELKVPRRAGALNLQMQISSLFKEVVADQLATRFDALGLENAILRIPKLEVDLGVIDPHYLQRDFVGLCVQAIDKEVERIFQLARLQLQANVSTEYANGADAIILSASRHQLAALKQFLQTGTLPAPYHSLSWETLESLWMAALEKEVSQIGLFLQSTLAQEPLAIERLLKQWSLPGLSQLIQLITKTVAREGPTTTQTVPTETEVRKKLAQITGWPPLVWEQLPARMLRIIQEWASTLDDIRQLRTAQDIQLTWQIQTLNTLITEPPAQWKNALEKTLEVRLKSKTFTTSISAATDEEMPAVDLEKIVEHTLPNEQDKQVVAHAGLVILHSFLPALFGHLDWLKEKLWKNRKCQERALHLLHYLAAGEEQAGEHQMYLAKLLCEWPTNWAVDRNVILTATEKQEADELLEAVLQHWSALKSTSIHLLRDGFLQRPGLLHRRERGWLLQVERKGQDLLLDKLPWGIGMIHLPWMKGELVVEW